MVIKFDIVPDRPLCLLFRFCRLDFGLLLLNWLDFVKLFFGDWGFQVEFRDVAAVVHIVDLEMAFLFWLLDFLGSIRDELGIVFRWPGTIIARIRLFKLMLFVFFLFNGKLLTPVIFLHIKYIGLLLFHIPRTGIQNMMVSLLLLRSVLKLAPVEL